MPTPARNARRVFVVALLFGCCGFGCGSTRSDLGEVSGRITLDDRPVADAFVQFISREGGTTSYGRTDKNGAYQMAATRKSEGASLGNNLVRISTADVQDQGGKAVKVPERIPAEYNVRSDLIRKVEAGENVFDFELKSSGKVVQPRLSD
jgi:hypothetical protein